MNYEMKKLGKILPEKTYMLRFQAGTAKGKHCKFDLATDIAGQPIIQSSKTNKFWTVSWQELIEKAIEAGINE